MALPTKRSLLLKRVVPLTIFSIALLTKWWHAIPLDGPDKFYWGFPLAFVGEGFHTSMSLQLFFLEFIFDVVFYFLSWLLFYFLMKRFGLQRALKNWITRTVWTLSILVILFSGLIVINSSPVFKWKRPYDWQVKSTGYIFIWEQTPIVKNTDN